MASRAGAARQLVLRYVADARDFIRPTQQATDALDDQAREAAALERALGKLDAQYADTGRAADRAADDLRASSGKVGEVGREAGAEFSQNFGESVRSGDPAGALIETITNAGGMFGPAGLAVAGLFGIGAALVKDVQDQAARLREAGRSAWEAMQDGVLDAAESKVQLTAALGVDDWEAAVDRLAEQAAELGVGAREYAAYLQSGVDPAGRIAAALEAGERAQARARGDRDAAQASLSAQESAAANLATYRERYTSALERGNQLLVREQAIMDGILNTARQTQEARWADPLYGAAYARSGGYRP